MSQIVTRKGPVKEDKDKRQTDSPVKEMKKKIAANAEKEKQAAEKNAAEKSVLNEKRQEKNKDKEHVEKPAEKSSDKKDKQEKTLDKSVEKKDKPDKSDKKEASDKKETMDKKEKESKEDKLVEKKEKPVEKKEKPVEKKEPQPEKSSESTKDKNEKADLPEDKRKNPEPKAKENGAKLNGEQNGDTVSSEDEHESDVEKDEMFPELAYEDSDGEGFEPPTPEGPSRSYTRRSQVKAARTPETPRPPSALPPPAAGGDCLPDDSKLLKLKDDTPMSDRKLRSSDSPKPQDKKIDKKSDSPKKDALKPVQEEQKEDAEKEIEGHKNVVEIEVVVELDNNEDAEGTEVREVTEVEPRTKADTNYSRSRVKVSPYRRSARGDADLSLLANYTGNNTTMEMDITESSILTEETPESPYLSGLRSIRGRRSYKPLKEMNLRNISANRSTRSTTSSLFDQPSRPTGTVVGRKRKPDSEVESEEAEEAQEVEPREVGVEIRGRGKRARLLDRLARPFRTVPLVARRNAEIVGINTDLPLTAPVASAQPFDPEAIKPALVPPTAPTGPAPAPTTADRDSKKCLVM